MRLLIFGPTGGTGARLMTQALAAGHDVTVVARDPRAIEVADGARATVVTGDVLQPASWTAAMSGQDAVLSCLGSRDRKRPTTVYSQGARNILAAMNAIGVRRLVCISSAGLEIPAGTPAMQRLVTRLVVQRLYRRGYTDMAAMESVVGASGVDWTIVRPPMLTDGPLTGHPWAAVTGHLPNASSISRQDLAHYLLTHIEDRETWQKVIDVSS